MKKIVHIQLLPLTSGVQRVTINELSMLKNSEYEKFIICKHPGEMTRIAEEMGIKCIYIKTLTRDISPIKDIYSFILLLRIMKQYNFDIVHTHSSKTGVLGRIAAYLCKVKCIVHTVHGFAFSSTESKLKLKLFKTLESIASKCSHKIICLHEDDKMIANNELKIPLSKIEIIPNGVDLNLFSPKKISIPLDKKKLKIGMVGRLWKQKNPQLLLNAAIDICNTTITHSEFYFLGDGELRNNMQQTIINNNLSERIHILGWQDNVSSFLNDIDIFILPSLWEGMPLAILEAMSCGLPCIVSNIQGNNSLIQDKITGLLFESNNKSSLVSSILLLLNNHKLREQLGNNARQKVIDKYNIETRIIKIDSLYSLYF